jgi:hypothetical protein
MQVPTKNIQRTQVEGKIFKSLNIGRLSWINMCCIQIFYVIDMDDVDIGLGYPWMVSVGTININVQNKFLKLSYKKKKITLQDISLIKREGPNEAHEELHIKMSHLSAAP